ncbi:hypothetical protein KCU93_g315, partial [Aureobasidium melanogenum]
MTDDECSREPFDGFGGDEQKEEKGEKIMTLWQGNLLNNNLLPSFLPFLDHVAAFLPRSNNSTWIRPPTLEILTDELVDHFGM